jgi:RHS repeat-associated protein
VIECREIDGRPGRGHAISGLGANPIYLVNRYYDPSTDQFLSIDPKVAQTDQPYAFTNDNPLNATDPLGDVSSIFACDGQGVYKTAKARAAACTQQKAALAKFNKASSANQSGGLDLVALVEAVGNGAAYGAQRLAQAGVDTATAAGHVAPEVQSAAANVAPYVERAGLQASGGLVALNFVTDLSQGHGLAYAIGGSLTSAVTAPLGAGAGAFLCAPFDPVVTTACGAGGFIAGGIYGNVCGGQTAQDFWNRFG